MPPRYALAFAVVALAPAVAGAADPVRVVKIESKALKTTETVRVWTPPGYAADKDRRYPVVYCCQNTGIPTRQLETLYAAGHFPPALFVNYEGPSQGGEHAAAAAWSDRRQPSGSFFRGEVIPWVDANYRTVAGPKGRVLVGCSKAGGGVMHLALKYPDLFGAVVSLDGWMTLYDKHTRDLDYTADGDGYVQQIEKHGAAVRDTPVLLIEGGWFWRQGRDYLGRFRKAGMTDVETIDARDLDHGVGAMFERHLPEILTTFTNAALPATPDKPTIDPPGGVIVPGTKVTLTAPKGVKLLYTLDGSDPSKGKRAYAGPIALDKSCLFRAVGVTGDGTFTRQSIARFDVRPARKPDAEPGANAGLELKLYAGSLGKGKDDLLKAILGGKGEPVHAGESAGFSLPEAATKAAPGKEFTARFAGVVTVPETGVYQFQLTGSSVGLYLADEKGGFVPVAQTRGQDKTVEAALALEKGGHRVLVVNSWPRSREPFEVLLRGTEGTFAPLPAKMLSH
ncbi:MAG: hypothetical protein C0501_18960 [Isosphaera sp.]|nr:hypothetical protein [Isosphaera sp.]